MQRLISSSTNEKERKVHIPLRTSDSWAESCSFCGSLEEARGPHALYGPSCLLNFPLRFINRQVADVRSPCVCACPLLCVCSTCLLRLEIHEAWLPPRSGPRPPVVDAHGTWMIDDGVNLSNNKARGAQAQGSFSVLGYGCVSPTEEEGTRHRQLQMPVPGCPARNALPLKAKGKSSKQRNKPPGKL